MPCAATCFWYISPFLSISRANLSTQYPRTFLMKFQVHHNVAPTTGKYVAVDDSFYVSALERALKRYGYPEIIKMDQGTQYAGGSFIGIMKEYGIRISMVGKGRDDPCRGLPVRCLAGGCMARPEDVWPGRPRLASASCRIRSARATLRRDVIPKMRR